MPGLPLSAGWMKPPHSRAAPTQRAPERCVIWEDKPAETIESVASH